MRVQLGPRVYWSIQWRTEEAEQQWCCRQLHWQGASSSWHVYSRQFPSKKTLNWPRPLKGSSQAVGCRLKTQTAITLKKTRGISTCCLWCWQEECRQQHWGWKKCKRKIIVAQTVKRLPLGTSSLVIYTWSISASWQWEKVSLGWHCFPIYKLGSTLDNESCILVPTLIITGFKVILVPEIFAVKETALLTSFYYYWSQHLDLQ